MSKLCALLVAGVVLLGASGCGGRGAAQHPLTNDLDPAFPTLAIKTLAAVPFASDIAEDEDPDRISASMTEGKFYTALNVGSGFTILPATEVQRTVERDGLGETMKSFYKNWINDQGDVDTDFIKKVATAMKADAVVTGAVDVWHQQPVDITQTGTARTTVGMLVGLFDGATGKRLWLGRDEKFKEALRHTPSSQESDLVQNQQRAQMERTNLRTATGVYAPPDYAPVVDALVVALVQAFPKRVK
jgi:hypothetical protein